METYAVDWVEWCVHRVFFWESDNEKKGRILRAIHHFVSYALITMVLISHTIYPAFWLQSCVLGCSMLVWIHHVLTNGCVVSKVEQRLLQDEESFMDPYLELFRVKTDNASKNGLLTMGSTIAVGLLTLEWIGRVHHKVTRVLQTAPALILSAVPGIPPTLSSP